MNINQHTLVIHRLYDQHVNHRKQVFFVLGPNAGVGASYCSLNIAKAASELLANLSVLLIDMNLHDSTLSREVGQNMLGWVRWVAEADTPDLKEVIVPWPGNDHLSFLPVGHTGTYRDAAVHMPKWSDMFVTLRNEFDLILVDVPPFFQGADARILCKAADDILLVIQADCTRRPIMHQMIAELEGIQASILGVVLNKRQFHIPRWIYERFF